MVIQMKIINLVLENIGPYSGINEFDFSTDEKHNIVLIGGKNGSGKTTLLKSLKIGLFGCFSFGYRNENATYFSEVVKMLSNRAKSKNYRITLTIEYVENMSRDVYKITRKWIKTENSIQESVVIIKNNEVLQADDANEFINKLRSISSPSLINSFIYDGEKIGNIIEANQVRQYIQGLFDSIFSIDLLNQFERDLTGYLNSKEVAVSGEEYELTTIINRVNACKAEIKNETEYAEYLGQKVIDVKIKISALQKELIQLGGASKEDIIQYQLDLKNLEHSTEDNNRVLREFYEDYLPFSMVRTEIKYIIKRAEKELPKVYGDMLVAVSKYLKVDFSNYIEQLSIPFDEVLFGLQEDDIKELKKLVDLLTEKQKNAVKILSQKEEMVGRLNSIRGTITNNETIDRIDEIIHQLENLQNELSQLKADEMVKTQRIGELQKEKEELLKKYEELFDRHKKEKLLGNSYVLCANTLDICEKLKTYIKDEKLSKVAQTCCILFNKTIRKENYLSGLTIDSNFNLHLYLDNKEITADYLSAGETQVLVSCLIWAMFKISGRREMFIFDTPLARLDEENRTSFSQNIVSTISGQVVVLSTDSEYIKGNLDVIKDRIAKTYLLNYDGSRKETKVINSYFGE